jgi:hypothetical protein
LDKSEIYHCEGLNFANFKFTANIAKFITLDENKYIDLNNGQLKEREKKVWEQSSTTNL